MSQENYDMIEYAGVKYYYSMSCGEPTLQAVDTGEGMDYQTFGFDYDFEEAYYEWEQGEMENYKNDWL